jgi:hypothetical protein
MSASTSPGRACPLIPSRISTGGAPCAPPATVTRTSYHVKNALGSLSAPTTTSSRPGVAAPLLVPEGRRPLIPHEKTLPSDHAPAPVPPPPVSGSGVPPPQRQRGRDGLGVGAHCGSGDVAIAGYPASLFDLRFSCELRVLLHSSTHHENWPPCCGAV